MPEIILSFFQNGTCKEYFRSVFLHNPLNYVNYLKVVLTLYDLSLKFAPTKS